MSEWIELKVSAVTACGHTPLIRSRTGIENTHIGVEAGCRRKSARLSALRPNLSDVLSFAALGLPATRNVKSAFRPSFCRTPCPGPLSRPSSGNSRPTGSRRGSSTCPELVGTRRGGDGLRLARMDPPRFFQANRPVRSGLRHRESRLSRRLGVRFTRTQARRFARVYCRAPSGTPLLTDGRDATK